MVVLRRQRWMNVPAVLALGGALGSSLACGVMFGAEEGDLVTVESGGAAGYGGYAGYAGYGGYGGYGGYAGYGGSGGYSGYGGSAGYGGYGGSGGSGGGPTVGGSCSTPSTKLSCGCDGYGGCNLVLRCSAGFYEQLTSCQPGVACVQFSNMVGCGTDDFYVPLVLPGTACTNPNGYACSADLATEMKCTGSYWAEYKSCSSQYKTCQAVKPGPTCSSATFCVGCL